MNRFKPIFAALALAAACGAHAQTNGVPDNDWLMKQPVPSGKAVATQPAPPADAAQTGAAASAKKNTAPPPVGTLDSSYGRP